MNDFDDALASHRAELLRHCYRMLGAFADAEDIVQDVFVNAWKARASYAGNVPLAHWLMRIATNACLNELARRKRRGLPQLEHHAATAIEPIEQLEASDWLTPAPDAQLFTAAPSLEMRESVALAFVALLQRLPPRQRAALLLKDVVGWSTEEIADALEMTAASVSSALHRARETITLPQEISQKNISDDPPPDVLREYIRSWETRDIDALVRVLHDDVVFAMPPHATWFFGKKMLGAFFRGDRLSRGFLSLESRVVETRANGALALAFYVRDGAGFKPHSLQMVEWRDARVASAIQFVGGDYLRGFNVDEAALKIADPRSAR